MTVFFAGCRNVPTWVSTWPWPVTLVGMDGEAHGPERQLERRDGVGRTGHDREARVRAIGVAHDDEDDEASR